MYLKMPNNELNYFLFPHVYLVIQVIIKIEANHLFSIKITTLHLDIVQCLEHSFNR